MAPFLTNFTPINDVSFGVSSKCCMIRLTAQEKKKGLFYYSLNFYKK